MIMKLARSGKKWKMILSAALVLILIAGIFAASAYARYRTKVIIANEVKYTNQLAERFVLTNKASAQTADGSYVLTTDENAGNTYYLIPGTQPPAEPHIQITNKTEIPAYLFVEIVSANGPVVSMGTGWDALGVTGKNGGQIFAYQTVLDGTEEDLDIPAALVLNTLSKTPAEAGGSLTVYAYMIQKTDSEAYSTELAKTAFTSAVSQTTQP